MPNRLICAWFTMAISAINATSRVAEAEFTFFSSRADWEAEAKNRGLLVAEENFDDFADGFLGTALGGEIESFAVGEIQFNPTQAAGEIRGGKLIQRFGTAIRFGYFDTEQEFLDTGTIDGPLGGIGMDLDVADPATTRELVLLDRPARNVLQVETYLDDGFVGVLFDSAREAEGFNFSSSRHLISADNLLVAAFPIPEPSTLGLTTAAALLLGAVRRGRAVVAAGGARDRLSTPLSKH